LLKRSNKAAPNNRHWSFASTEGMNYTVCIPKNCGHHLSGRLYGAGEVHCFDCSSVSSVKWWIRVSSTVMNRRRNSSGLCWNISKHYFKITWSRLWSTMSKSCVAPAILPIAFSYPIVRAKLKSLCHVICLWPQQARALSLIKTISWTLSMISDVTASIGHPEGCITCGCMTTFKFIHPIVYSRWCRCAMKSLSNSLISFGLNLWYVDVWCMKLVFFHFAKKGCSL